jgi:hypothetical protein
MMKMGMFDWITCEYPLPDYPKNAPRDEFQTKDLALVCDEYTIDGNGILKLTRCSYSERVNENSHYIGTLNFYHKYKDDWYEYDAEFIDGKLISVNRV